MVETLVKSGLRKATISDVPKMQKLINAAADRGDMLHRSLNELYENIRDFYIFEENGETGMCCHSCDVG